MCNIHHGNFYSVTVGVGQVAKDEQRSLLGQRLRHREVPQLGADVLHGGALQHTQIRQISTPTAAEGQSASNSA